MSLVCKENIGKLFYHIGYDDFTSFDRYFTANIWFYEDGFWHWSSEWADISDAAKGSLLMVGIRRKDLHALNYGSKTGIFLAGKHFVGIREDIVGLVR
jgi:hypothetical protein